MASPELQAGVISLVRSYEERIAGLENRLGDPEDRLKLNPTNSSKTPSSDPIGMKRKPPAAPVGKTRGGQPGRRKARRTLVPPEKVRETLECNPDSCRRWGHGLAGDDPEPVTHRVAESPRIGPIVGADRLRLLTCPACRATTCGASPAGVPTGCFGPHLRAVPAMFAGAYRLGERQIRQVAADALTPSTSTGLISDPGRQSAALESPDNGLAVAAHPAEATNSGEASWRERFRKVWLWATVTPLFAAFTIARYRSGDVAKALPGGEDGQVVKKRRWI